MAKPDMFEKIISIVPDIIKGIDKGYSKRETERENTKKASRDAEKEERIKSFDVVGNAVSQAMDVAQKTTHQSNKSLSQANKDMGDIAKKGMDIAEKTTSQSNENLSKIANTANDKIEKITDNHQKQLEKKDSAIEQLQNIFSQVKEFEIKEKINKELHVKIMEYAEYIQKCNLEISKVEDMIDRENQKNQKDQLELRSTEDDINYKKRKLEDLDSKFSHKIKSIEELKRENKRGAYKENKYTEIFAIKIDELKELIDDIEDEEASLLNMEKYRLETVEKLEPKLNYIEELEITVKQWKLTKNYYESTGLHSVANLQIENQDTKAINDVNVIDTSVIENSLLEKK